MKNILYILFVILTMSCSSDDEGFVNDYDLSNDNSQNNQTENPLLITKIESYDRDGTLKSTSIPTYNNDNFVSKVKHRDEDGSNSETRYTYNNGNIVKRTSFKDGIPTGLTYEYRYADNLIIERIERSGDYISHDFFEYDSFGNIEFKHSGTGSNIVYYDYDSKNNLIKLRNTNYTYDNKPNYGVLIFPNNFLKLDGSGGRNNRIKEEYDDSVKTKTYSYTYSSKGFPTSIVTIYSEPTNYPNHYSEIKLYYNK